jgi:hypothetical protein
VESRRLSWKGEYLATSHPHGAKESSYVLLKFYISYWRDERRKPLVEKKLKHFASLKKGAELGGKSLLACN